MLRRRQQRTNHKNLQVSVQSELVGWSDYVQIHHPCDSRQLDDLDRDYIPCHSGIFLVLLPRLSRILPKIKQKNVCFKIKKTVLSHWKFNAPSVAELSTGHYSWTRPGETLTRPDPTRPDPRFPTQSDPTWPDTRLDPSSICTLFNWIIIYQLFNYYLLNIVENQSIRM